MERRRLVSGFSGGGSRAECAARSHDRLDNLERTGIDEISLRRGQCYLTLVVYHVTGWLDWAIEGRSKKVVESFFAQLGQQRCAQLAHVSSEWRRVDPGPG